MFTEAHAGKGTWTNRIKSHRLLHSMARLKYHGAALCLCCWKLDRPICSRNKSSPGRFYLLTQAQVFGREAELICWWGNKSTKRSSTLELWRVVPSSQVFVDSVKLKLNLKNVRHFALESGLLRSKEGEDAWTQIPPSSVQWSRERLQPEEQNWVCLHALNSSWSWSGVQTEIIIAWE